MAISSTLPFPLVIVCLLFIRGYSSLPTTSGVTGTISPTDDYDQFDDPTPNSPNEVSPNGVIYQRCKYDPCIEGQVSCAVLAASTRCLCPGATLYDVIPDTPSLRSVSWNGSQVVIKWCAPNSYVTGYVVTVKGQEWQKFGMAQRSGTLGDIEHIAKVCVVAVNDIGASNGSCMEYHPRDTSLPLTAGLIGGALGFLLLLSLAVLLWRHQRQRKQEASISMHDTAGAQ
ncbi:leucine-rich repeat neuronal protein 4-like [Seriola lalandi dorsalis]|uniref:Leucine-rich repeat neuronal protein 4-like n=1 Tax=Seriola lalandi dorsalis TaxID=1841481 RepID=A0A3B4YA97_SERLL|nr:leucine-rich repeat neuronal protein 4-like [Seriola lalandi dorsalis]